MNWKAIAGIGIAAAAGAVLLNQKKEESPVPPPGAGLSIVTGSLGPFERGVRISVTLEATGGSTPYDWSVSGLPHGLAFSAEGLVAGTPDTSGASTLSVFVRDAAGKSATKIITILVQDKVTPQPIGVPVIETAALPDGRAGAPYNALLAANGGSAPYLWSYNGPIPPGISVSSSGVISGTPGEIGKDAAYQISVKVTDKTGKFAQRDLSLRIASVPPPSTISIQATLPSAKVGQAYGAQLQATGGTGPYSWSSTGGMPAGMSLSSSGSLSGTPVSAGTAFIGISVRDAYGKVATATITFLTGDTVTLQAQVGSLKFSPSVIPPGGTTSTEIAFLYSGPAAEIELKLSLSGPTSKSFSTSLNVPKSDLLVQYKTAIDLAGPSTAGSYTATVALYAAGKLLSSNSFSNGLEVTTQVQAATINANKDGEGHVYFEGSLLPLTLQGMQPRIVVTDLGSFLWSDYITINARGGYISNPMPLSIGKSYTAALIVGPNAVTQVSFIG